MTADGWIAFGAALLGALVGGAASVAGSVYVNRREVVRSARLRLLEDFSPAAREAPLTSMASAGADVNSVLGAMHRVAVQAGRRELQHVATLTACAEAWLAEWRAGAGTDRDAHQARMDERRSEFLSALKTFDQWLEKKIL